MSANIPGYNQYQVQNFDKNQMGLYKKLFDLVGPQSFLSLLAQGDEGMFSQLEAPALRQFAGTQGNIASRFSGAGTGGRQSSGFQNSMNQAASNLSQDLQSQRMNLQNQAVRDLMSLSQQLLSNQPYTTFFEKEQKKPSFFDQLMKYGMPIVGGMAGGPAGAAAGNWAKDWMVENLPGRVI